MPQPIFGAAKLFSAEAIGYQVQLPEWRYPVVCDPLTGNIHFDNFQGRWGRQQELDRFLQGYAIEKTRLEARKAGHAVSEQQLPGGFVKLTIQVGAAA